MWALQKRMAFRHYIERCCTKDAYTGQTKSVIVVDVE
jgi:hypothetical protein